jgi:hypothetical protein
MPQIRQSARPWRHSLLGRPAARGFSIDARSASWRTYSLREMPRRFAAASIAASSSSANLIGVTVRAIVRVYYASGQSGCFDCMCLASCLNVRPQQGQTPAAARVRSLSRSLRKRVLAARCAFSAAFAWSSCA